jgi:hypothetical protein
MLAIKWGGRYSTTIRINLIFKEASFFRNLP